MIFYKLKDASDQELVEYLVMYMDKQQPPTERGRFVRPVTLIDIGPCPYPGWTGDFYRVHLGPIMQNGSTGFKT